MIKKTRTFGRGSRALGNASAAKSGGLSRVFFSIDYEGDLTRVNRIKRLPNVISCSAAGFDNAELWEETRRKGKDAMHVLIEDALHNTSVTVVCIGKRAAMRRYISYEIDASLNRGNAVLGLMLDQVTDETGRLDRKGQVPVVLVAAGCKVFPYLGPKQLRADINAVVANHNPYRRPILEEPVRAVAKGLERFGRPFGASNLALGY